MSKLPVRILIHVEEDMMAFTDVDHARRSIFITWDNEKYNPTIIKEYDQNNYYIFVVQIKDEKEFLKIETVKFRFIWLFDEPQHL